MELNSGAMPPTQISNEFLLSKRRAYESFLIKKPENMSRHFLNFRDYANPNAFRILYFKTPFKNILNWVPDESKIQNFLQH